MGEHCGSARNGKKYHEAFFVALHCSTRWFDQRYYASALSTKSVNKSRQHRKKFPWENLRDRRESNLEPHGGKRKRYPLCYATPTPQFERMSIEWEKKYKQRDLVFLKVDALEWWKMKKSKKSIEIQKSYRALKMMENRLSFNQILMQLQAISEQSL